jgi:Zn-dependent protease with chaperone function
MRRSVVPFVVLGIAHCSAGADDVGSASAAHTAHDPVQSNSPYFWAETDYATFRLVAQAAPFRVGQPLADDDVLVTRMQTWTDRLHDEVAKDVTDKTGQALAAPRPIVKVVPAKAENAWVSGIPACLTGSADLSTIGGARASRSAPLAFVQYDVVKEAQSWLGAPSPRCATPANWHDPAALEPFFDGLGAKCTIAGPLDAVHVEGEGCTIASSGPTSATHLTMYAPSPFVHITSAMIALAHDERGVVGILAHELGHYYRAHAVSDLVMNRYNYWYEQTWPAPDARPTPTSDSASLEARFDTVMPIPMPRVDGQKLSYRLTSFLLDGLGDLLRAAGACTDAVSALDGDWRSSFGLGTFWVSADAQAKYLAFESSLLACAANVPVADAKGPGALGVADLHAAIAVHASQLADVAIAPSTLADALAALNARATSFDADADAFLALVRDRNLGKYTAEQEADEFSVEYFARIGLDPAARVSTYLDMIEAHLDAPEHFRAANGGLDFPACKALYLARWMAPDDGGTPKHVVVPLGNLHDPHHGDCFRLFNMAREIEAHHLVAGQAGPPTFVQDWESVRAHAQAITDAFVVPPGSHLAEGGATPAGGVTIDGP